MPPLCQVRRKLREWLAARVITQYKDCEDGKVSKCVDAAELELLRLATDKDATAFYGADLDALCTRFSGAALLVLDYPKLSLELYLLLTIHAKHQDAELLLRDYKPVIPIPGLAEKQYTVVELTTSAEERYKITETRNRNRHQVTQSIASFQTSASAQWQRKLKLWSWGVSAGLTMIAFLMSDVSWNQIGWLMLLSVTSGFLAPIARDLLAALQQLRT